MMPNSLKEYVSAARCLQTSAKFLEGGRNITDPVAAATGGGATRPLRCRGAAMIEADATENCEIYIVLRSYPTCIQRRGWSCV